MKRRGMLFAASVVLMLVVGVVAGCQRGGHCPGGQCGVSAYDAYSTPQPSYSSGPLDGTAVHGAAPSGSPYVSQPAAAPGPSYGGSGSR